MILYWVLTSLALVGVSFQDNQGTPTVTLDRFCHKKDFSGWIFVKHLDALSPTWQASILLFLSSAQIFVGPMSTGELESDMKLNNRLFGFLTFGQNLLSPLSKIVVSYLHRTRKVTTIERYFTVSESRKLLLAIFFRDHTDGKLNEFQAKSSFIILATWWFLGAVCPKLVVGIPLLPTLRSSLPPTPADDDRD